MVPLLVPIVFKVVIADLSGPLTIRQFGHVDLLRTHSSMVCLLAFDFSSIGSSSADTFSNLTTVSTDGGQNSTYVWSEKGIAWPGEARKYAEKPGYDVSQMVPPPNWRERFPDNYTNENIPNLHEDEHFQNWMRTAGLPTFTKLWGRNDDTALAPGQYQITAFMSEIS